MPEHQILNRKIRCIYCFQLCRFKLFLIDFGILNDSTLNIYIFNDKIGTIKGRKISVMCNF